MEYDYTKIGNRIRNERIKTGYDSQTEFLTALNYSDTNVKTRQTLSKWENGTKLPNLDILVTMCKIFDCEMGYLLCEYDCKTREATDIHNATGLSEKAIDKLQNINNSSKCGMIKILNGLIEHSLFIKLLQSIQEYITNFYAGMSHTDDNNQKAIADYMNCSPNDVNDYMETISKVLIQGIVAQITSDWNNKEEIFPGYPKKLFPIDY